MPRVKRKYHYFYKITNNLNNHFYYGVHSTNDLNDGYMGSGVRLHYAYKKYGVENFTKEILKFFDTREKANEYEAEIVNEELIKDENCYNVIKGGGFDTSGLVSVKDKNGKYYLVSLDDPRYLSGELVGATKGKVNVKDKNGNYYQVSLDDPRYLSGELVGVSKGMLQIKDKDGNHHLVPLDDPRYLSGELVPFSKGMILVKDKYEKYYQVPLDDPGYLSGELVPFWVNRKHKPETIEKAKQKFKNIKHQQGEKNSQYGTCWIHNDKESIKIKKEDLEKYLTEGWIKGRKMRF